MLVQVLSLAILAWLPGAVIFRAPIGDRSSRAQLDAEERLFWAVIISLAVSLTVVLTLAAAGRYTFSRLLIVDAALAAAVAAASRFDLRLGTARLRPALSALLPLTLIALGIWRFFPPAEFVVGGKDPGIYMNQGIQIAQRGTLVYEDPLVRSIPPFARDLFLRYDGRPDFYGLRFMGFYLLDVEAGRVVGQFPHLFPASIAIGYGVDGLTGARRTAGVWAILGLLSVYFTGARLFGRPIAWAAAALLALHLMQVWFGRYPNAEVVMQALLWAALLAAARAHVDGQPFFAPLAGFLLGLMIFLRVDAVVAVAGVLAGLALFRMTGGRWRAAFFLPLLIAAPLAIAYLAGPLWPQAERYYIYWRTMQFWQRLALVLLGTSALAGIAIASRSEGVRSRVRVFAPRLLAGALVAAAVYALYFREPRGRLAAHDAYALRTFTQHYLTLPALVAALIGYALAARRVFWRAPALMTTVALYCFFFFYKIRIVPEHFWMSRRFLPVILPAALLFAAAAAMGTRGGGTLVRRLRWGIGLLFLALLGAEYARRSQAAVDHVEYAGIIPRLERLAATVGDDDLLIVESRDAQTDVHTLAVPLAYIYARNVLVFTSAAPDKTAFGSFLTWASPEYDRVLFLGAGGTDLLSRSWSARVVATERFRVPEFVGGPDEFPRHPRAKQFDYTIYEFTPPAPGVAQREVVVDVGTEDDLNVLRFHAKEETEGRSFRWSQDVSYIIVPGVSATDRLVTVWMSDGGRPQAAAAATVAVHLDDEPIGSARVETGFRPYTFELPAALAARIAAGGVPVRLRLTTSSVWSPEEMLGTPDDRELGVMVDRVTIK